MKAGDVIAVAMPETEAKLRKAMGSLANKNKIMLDALVKAEDCMRWSYDVDMGSQSAVEALQAVRAAISEAAQ